MKDLVDTGGFCALITCNFCKLNNFSWCCNLVNVKTVSRNKNVIRFSPICGISRLSYTVLIIMAKSSVFVFNAFFISLFLVMVIYPPCVIP